MQHLTSAARSACRVPARAALARQQRLYSTPRDETPPHSPAPSSGESSLGKASASSAAASSSSSAAPAPAQAQAPKPDFSQSTSTAAAAANLQPLPFLSHPLGVPERPSNRKLTWSEVRSRALDRDRRLQVRQNIVKEATQGYFHDFHKLRSHGGKTWRAPGTLIRDDRSLYFPLMSGTRLADGKEIDTAQLLPGKVSIVAILTSAVSEEHTKSFYTAAFEAHGSHPAFQLVQINLQENRLKSVLVRMFLSSLRQKIAPPLAETYMLCAQSMDLQREAIGLHNKHVGYTYLVGPDGLIRWAGGAFAEPSEQQALVACTGVLLGRLDGAQSKK